MNHSRPLGLSVHGILQARILEWVVISFSNGSSWPRDLTHISYIGRQNFYHKATREAPEIYMMYVKEYIYTKEVLFSNGAKVMLEWGGKVGCQGFISCKMLKKRQKLYKLKKDGAMRYQYSRIFVQGGSNKKSQGSNQGGLCIMLKSWDSSRFMIGNI